MSFDKSLHTVSRQLPQETVPPSLRARVLDTLPESALRPAYRLAQRLFLAASVAFVVGIGLFALPKIGMKPVNAQEVQSAIRQTHSWHFVGFYIKQGKKLSWEVWGREKPFFYREQIGDDILIDNGTTRTRILPPEPENARKSGVYLVTPSPASQNDGVRHIDSISGVTGESLIGSGSGSRRIDIRSLSGDIVRIGETDFIGKNSLREITEMRINRVNNLPIAYTVRRVSGNPPHIETIAALDVAYNVPVADSLAIVVPPAGYIVQDLASGTPPNATDSVCTKQGLTLRAEISAQDTSGNLRLKFWGSMGDTPMDAAKTGLGLAILNTPFVDVRDDRGNIYLPIFLPLGVSFDSNAPEQYLVPLEPLQPGSPRPKQLTIALPFELSRYERMGNSGRTVAVVGDGFTFKLPLPNVPAETVGYDESHSSPGTDYIGIKGTLALIAAEARGMYYFGKPLGQKTYVDGKRVSPTDDEIHTMIARAAFWYKTAATESLRIGDKANAARIRKNAEQLPKIEAAALKS